MKTKLFLLGFLLPLHFLTFAQEKPKEVLFTIDQKPYYTEEFKRVYNKNIDLVKDESQKDLNQYLELFIGYKLKINKAHKLGLQNNDAYKNELNSYRSQLAKNYLTDSKVTKELIEEGYSRSLKEVKASHILLTLDEKATPADTLAAFKKIKDLRERALKGEDFGKLAQENSMDPSAKENLGNLGYFSAFRMVYPFESAAFNTKKGDISKIVRTRFGYHIIKVDDIRDNRGEVTVAHIMIMKPTTEEATEKENTKATIDDIYKKLQQGEEFEALAKQFSQDKSSAPKGGLLNKFSSGQLSSEEFENVAFSLSKENPISKPFLSQFGWHIIKFIEKHSVKTMDEMKFEIENKIERDERSRIIETSMNEKLRKKYAPKRDDKLYDLVKKTINESFYNAQWKMPTNLKPFDKVLVSFKDNSFTATEFLNFIEKFQKNPDNIKPIGKMVDNFYQRFLDFEINKHYDANLENEFPEFANVMEEYRDGLLLFDLMEKEIWEKSKNDTLGFTKYYENHKQKYLWKKRFDVLMASSTSQDMVKKAQKMIKKSKSVADIKKELNTEEVVNIMITEGIFEEGNEALPKGYAHKEGLSDVLKDGNYYFIIKTNKILPAGSKSLEETRGRVINDYQQFLEENWVSDLKKEFKVEVNNQVFEKVKNEMKK